MSRYTVGGWKAYGTKTDGGHMSGDAGALPECEVDTPMTHDRTTFPVH